MSRPADDFVSELVGSGDVLRRFSLMTAGGAMEALPETTKDVPVIDELSYLREALGVLVESRAPYLIVQDHDGKHIGTLSMNAIQRAAAPQDG